MVRPDNTTKPKRRSSLLVALWPVLLVAGFTVAGLLAVSGAYGFHRDELYFIVAGRHPAFGYPDQPPLTPLLSAASVSLFGLSPTAVRVLPALAMGLCRCPHRPRWHVTWAIRAGPSCSPPSRSPSRVISPRAISALRPPLSFSSRPSCCGCSSSCWQVATGASGWPWVSRPGSGLQSKDTLLLLCAGLLAGVVLARRWDVVRSPWAWAAAGVALLIWAPNLVWQATHGLPQLTMAHIIAGDAAANRGQLLPILWLFTGPLLFLVTLAGWAWMLWGKTAARWRPIALAAVVVLVLVAASGGKGYYAVGIAPPLMAAGAILLHRWLARGRRRLRVVGFVAAAAVSGALVVYLTLPILPVATFVTDLAPLRGPDLVRADRLAAARRAGAAGGRRAACARARPRGWSLTENYGEAAALELLGKGLPPVYSGHNGFWGPGTAAGRPHGRGARRRLDGGRLEPVLRGLPHRRAPRQRARDRQPGTGAGHLGVRRPARAVDGYGKGCGISPEGSCVCVWYSCGLPMLVTESSTAYGGLMETVVLLFTVREMERTRRMGRRSHPSVAHSVRPTKCGIRECRWRRVLGILIGRPGSLPRCLPGETR